MEQAPVGVGEAAQKLADFEVVGGHGADQRHQVLAHMLGDGVLIDLDGQVITALGRIFMQGALQEGQGVLDLALELFLAEAENFMLFARKYAYIYAYFRASKSARQEGNVKNNEKKCPKELNCYDTSGVTKGSNHSFAHVWACGCNQIGRAHV